MWCVWVYVCVLCEVCGVVCVGVVCGVVVCGGGVCGVVCVWVCSDRRLCPHRCHQSV